MKNRIAFKALLIMIMFYSNYTFAQIGKDKNIPQFIMEAFFAKYPQAKVKKLKIMKDEYVVKFNLNRHTYYAFYYQSGNWEMTTSKIRWTWGLPSDVRSTLRKSKFAAWTVDDIKEVETPSLHFYQILVDNGNLQIDSQHVDLFKENWLLDFKTNGELDKEKNVTTKSLF